MTKVNPISATNTEVKTESAARCSIILFAGNNFSRLSTYLLDLGKMKLSDDYETIVINDHGLEFDKGLLRTLLPSLKVLEVSGLASQEQLFKKAVIAARGKYLLLVRKLINFDKLILEESIKDLETSGQKISISANKNFVLAERFHYTSMGGYGGLFGSCDLVTAEDLDVTNGAIAARAEVEIDKLRSMRKHRYKQEYLDWDLEIFDLPIQKTPHFQFIGDYQNDPKLKFESTSFWKLADSAFVIHKMKTNKTYILRNRGGVVTSAEQMCINFIKKYEKIKREGKFEPIEVTATHDGKYVITDGLHRASIAYALGYKKVPVIIKSVDEKLLKLMETLRDAYPKEGQKVLYIPVDHPVFRDWEALRDDIRWTLIKDEFDWKDKTILDVGSYTGYFSHKIAKLGGNVTGIEIDKDRLSQSKMINILLESNVEFLHADFLEYLRDKKFDCILLFSVLHWILKNKGTNGIREALNIVSSASPVMFLDMGQDNEPKMRLNEWNHGLTINAETIPDLVISNSKYKHFKHLGTGDTGRDVFKFTTFYERTMEGFEGSFDSVNSAKEDIEYVPSMGKNYFRNLHNESMPFKCCPGTFIDPEVIIDSPKSVKIGSNCIIRKGVVLRPEGGEIIIGDNCVINHYCVFHGKGGIYLGDWTIVAPHCGFYAQNQTYENFDVPITKQPNTGRGIYLMGDNWIGGHSVICDDVTIGKGAVVGANSTVTKSIPMASIAVGSPARVIKKRYSGDWNFHNRERATTSGMPRKIYEHVRERGLLIKKLIDTKDSILDVGCGEGIITAILAEKAPNIVGCDYSIEAISLAKEQYPHIEFVYSNSTNLVFGNESLKKVIMSDVAEHLMPIQFVKTLFEVNRVLQRGGKLILATPITCKQKNTTTYAHIYEYSEAEMRQLLNEIFHEVELVNEKFGLFVAQKRSSECSG
jgi:acetyltransferase-like isoleucine patch superfamily enzyme/ubiquinone/menaquinone biosynthesis C-methylase UbiE